MSLAEHVLAHQVRSGSSWTLQDRVLCWLPNVAEGVISWFAINELGAVFVPINTAYRGKLLQHVVDNSQATVILAHEELLHRLTPETSGSLEDIIVLARAATGDDSSTENEPASDTNSVHAQLRLHTWSVLTDSPSPNPDAEQIESWDVQSVLYTSGTTGPSKGVISSYAHLGSVGGPDGSPHLQQHDRFLIHAPLFHQSATAFVHAMLMRGGSIALVSGFRTEEFWNVIDATKATATVLIGGTAHYLLQQPPSPLDNQHSLRKALVVPITDSTQEFVSRFGVDAYTCWNMTETSIPIRSEKNERRPGCAGKPRPGVDVRIVDAHDCETASGAVGELIVRTDAPWAMNSGYLGNPAATAQAWRNGWFHTGDAFRVDEAGYYYFVDRIKDTIRRKGENISSFEVEVEVAEFPGIQEAAAIAVPNDVAEDEVMVVVTPTPGTIIDYLELIDFLADRLPYYAIPRYIRIVDELPQTPTFKVMKSELRSDGITPHTWDRETDGGLRFQREKLT